MSIYYYRKLIGTYDLDQKKSSPTLVGDIIKSRADYQTYTSKTKFVVRHYQDA